MIFQAVLIQRIITIIIFQNWVVILQIILAYKLIKRARNVLTFTLSTHFLMNSVSYLFSFLSSILANTPSAYIIFILTWFFGIFSLGFLVIFSWELNKLRNPIQVKSIIPLIVCYGIISLYNTLIALFTKGIRYGVETAWIPIFSWGFAINTWVLLAIFIIFPQTILVIRLFKTFEGLSIKKRLIMYGFSSYLELLVVILLILYNTWVDNTIFRIFFIIIAFPSGLVAAYLMYRSLIKGLEKEG